MSLVTVSLRASGSVARLLRRCSSTPAGCLVRVSSRCSLGSDGMQTGLPLSGHTCHRVTRHGSDLSPPTPLSACPMLTYGSSRQLHQLSALPGTYHAQAHVKHADSQVSAASSSTQKDGAKAATAVSASAPADVQGVHNSTAVFRQSGLVKRRVALHLAYLGTNYKGLVFQPNLGADATVEGVLERAIHAMGGLRDSNYGFPTKSGWGRSSRTDKGVHALAAVVTLKMETPSDAFEADPEGIALATAINAHLPPEIRVLAVQRVNNSFSGRAYCDRRSYHYYLPLSILAPNQTDLPAAELEARVQRLRACLNRFEGNHPFHNYTRRKLYGRDANDSRRGSTPKQALVEVQNGAEAATAAKVEGEATQSSLADDDHAAGSASQTSIMGSANSASAAHAAHRLAQRAPAEAISIASHAAQPHEATSVDSRQQDADSADAGGSESDSEDAEPQGSGRYRERPLRYQWQHLKSGGDKVSISHYRMITTSTCGSPITLAPGAPPCLQITITGASFMLHQIRHMIGTAVAYALGQLPWGFVEATLSAPARAYLPMAPAEVLILADSAFRPFPATFASPAQVAVWSGDSLQLRTRGQAAQAEFVGQVLHPAMASLLQAPVWQDFDSDLQRMTYDSAEMDALLTAHAVWEAGKADRAAARLQARAQQQAGAKGDLAAAGQEDS